MSVEYTLRCLTCDNPVRSSRRGGTSFAYCVDCGRWSVYGEDSDERESVLATCLRRSTRWPYEVVDVGDVRGVRIRTTKPHDCSHCRHGIWTRDIDPLTRRAHVGRICAQDGRRVLDSEARGADMPCWEGCE